ncbi:UNVERIFIED_CONTAM: integral membrane protein [Mumia flava]
MHKVAPDVQPLDVDGVRTMAVGSAIWLALGLGMLPFMSTLQANGTIWWLWTCVAGFGLGLMGVEYCRRRRAALADADSEADPGHDDAR